MGAPRYPETPVFYRKLNKSFPKIVRGEGCWLIDEQGKRYLDACGGAFVANCGHGVVEIARAIGEQASKIAYVNGTAFTNEPAEALAAEIARLCPGDLKKIYFLSSGSEAVEAALKLARQYWVELGKPSKRKIIARSPGYHGNTLLALSVSGRPQYKALFQDWLVPVASIPAPDAYRCACGGEGKDCPACSGSALEEAIRREGPSTVAAFIAEPVGGSSTGASVPRKDYYRRIRDICDRHEVLFIADEVLSGAGRTGTWSAMEPYGVVPDLITFGKGISGGYAPLSAIAAPQRILDALAKGSGGLMHAQTFSHTPLICAAGLAAVRYLNKHALIDRARLMGRALHSRLARLKELPIVGDVRGLGMLAGVELVQDKTSKEPFARAAKLAERVAEAAIEEGLVLWPNVGHVDGRGDILMIAPPFIISEREMDEIVVRFSRALEAAMKDISTKL